QHDVESGPPENSGYTNQLGLTATVAMASNHYSVGLWSSKPPTGEGMLSIQRWKTNLFEVGASLEWSHYVVIHWMPRSPGCRKNMSDIVGQTQIPYQRTTCHGRSYCGRMPHTPLHGILRFPHQATRDIFNSFYNRTYYAAQYEFLLQ